MCAPKMEKTCTSLSQHTFFGNHKQNRVIQMSPSYLKNKPFLFKVVCFTIMFIHDISCPSKGYSVHDENVHKIFTALYSSTKHFLLKAPWLNAFNFFSQFSSRFDYVSSNQILSFVEILSFAFFQVNSESGSYLAIDHSLLIP